MNNIPKLTILFISSAPNDMPRIRLDEELRGIKNALKNQDRFILEHCLAARPTDLAQAFLDYKPSIIHYAGHGLDTGELCFENHFEILEELFKTGRLKQILGSPIEKVQSYVDFFNSEELFLPELKFIELENVLLGVLTPEVDEPLVFNGERITPIIPLNSLILGYFTPEELLTKIKFQTVRTEEKITIRLILTLPLDRVREDLEFENYRLVKDYDLKEENSLGDQLPVLQIWPNFRKQDWREYYVFYYDGELAEQTFKVAYPQAKKNHTWKIKRKHTVKEGFGTFSIYHSEEFPECLSCKELKALLTVLGKQWASS
ncbi:MAG: hypothetical protein AB4372_04795 [Xenococcus sp. (in: cyanobacteria)]